MKHSTRQQVAQSLRRAADTLSASTSSDVNAFMKELRMKVDAQIDWYWEQAKKAKDPEEAAELNAAAEFLRKLHQGALMERF